MIGSAVWNEFHTLGGGITFDGVWGADVMFAERTTTMSDPQPVRTMATPAAAETPSAAASRDDSVSLGLRRGDQYFVGICVIAGLVLLAAYAFRLNGWGQPPIEIERLPARRYDYQLDVNRASWFEWTLLDGIGEKLARRIVADREQNGSFTTIEDVQRVAGIGPKTWEQIRPWLTVKKEE